MHKAVHGVTEDLEKFHFNRAVARIREATNALADAKGDGPDMAAAYKEGLEALIRLISPITPHIAEEIWASLGNTESVMKSAWPTTNEKLLVEDEILIPIQVNGKKKTEILMQRNLTVQQIEELVLKDKKIVLLTEGKKPKKIIVISGRIVNVVL